MYLKVTYEQTKKSFENEDYILLSKEYVNNKTKLNFICPQGHKHSITWSKWIQGQRCVFCRKEEKKKSFREIKQCFKSENYELISTDYINAHSKLDFICPRGHKHNINWNDWQQGQRCGNCAINKKKTFTEIKRAFECEGYKLLTTEYEPRKKLDFICPNGHKHNITWSDWKQAHRCGKCDSIKKTSKLEKEVCEYVRIIYQQNIIENDRTTIINPDTGYYLELDIFIPELRKAIEFNGTYWHSLSNTKERDIIKRNQCKNENIRLLVVDESDWLDDKKQIKENILKFLYKEV